LSVTSETDELADVVAPVVSRGADRGDKAFFRPLAEGVFLDTKDLFGDFGSDEGGIHPG
jgi:hypothetical protein